jgi:hypothetical protein
MRKSLILAVAALTCGLLAMPAAPASDTVCVGLATGPHDNIVVPEGAVCRVIAATVRGNIKVLRGGALHIDGATSVQGNVQATDQPLWISIPSGNTFHGDIQVTGVTAGPPEGAPFFGPRNLLCSNTVRENVEILDTAPGVNWSIGASPGAEPCGGAGLAIEEGNLLVQGNRGDVNISNVTVGRALFALPLGPLVTGGNLQAFKNVSVDMSFNRIRQNHQCKENASFTDVANDAGQDQCPEM